jgi:hypothetical protein
LTSDTDADAGDDEHIKALFHEIDANKDGKVSLVHSRCCQTRVFKTSSFCCRGAALKPAPSQCVPNRLTLLNIWGSMLLLLLRPLEQRTKAARLLKT